MLLTTTRADARPLVRPVAWGVVLGGVSLALGVYIALRVHFAPDSWLGYDWEMLGSATLMGFAIIDFVLLGVARLLRPEPARTVAWLGAASGAIPLVLFAMWETSMIASG
jgi:hypothetical protein